MILGSEDYFGVSAATLFHPEATPIHPIHKHLPLTQNVKLETELYVVLTSCEHWLCGRFCVIGHMTPDLL